MSKNESTSENWCSAKWYYEKWHSYDKKKIPIQRLYLEVIEWANKRAPFNLLNGKGRRALDVGCAHGYIVELLERLEYEAYGCDIEGFYVHNYAKRNNPNLMVCDAQKLPFTEAVFDVITCFEVIEHLSSQTSFLVDCYKSLKQNGVLIIQTPKEIPSLDGLFAKLRSRAIAKRIDIEQHVSTLVNTSDLERLLSYRGFNSNVETWFLLPIKATIADRYFATRIPTTMATFRAIAVKK